jgi:hypothetical protein
MSASGMKQGRKGIGRNQGAERLKKPESAAQPGEVNPVQVASQYQSAVGERNLKRVGLGDQGNFRVDRETRRRRMGQTFQWGERSREERGFSAENPLRDLSGKPQGASVKEKHEEGSAEPIRHVPAGLIKL